MEFILFKILGYDVSVVELVGTIAGLLSVWFAAKNNILTWPTGILNVVCFFFIFRTTGLFSDMFLQVYFFVVAIYGWYYWKRVSAESAASISILSSRSRVILLLITSVFSVLIGGIMTQIHLWLPSFFTQPAAWPFVDTFVAVASVVANTLMARKKIESWIMWIVIDVLATFIYYQKGIFLISAEFLIFTVLAIFGLMNWAKLMKNQPDSML